MCILPSFTSPPLRLMFVCAMWFANYRVISSFIILHVGWNEATAIKAGNYSDYLCQTIQLGFKKIFAAQFQSIVQSLFPINSLPGTFYHLQRVSCSQMIGMFPEHMCAISFSSNPSLKPNFSVRLLIKLFNFNVTKLK